MRLEKVPCQYRKHHFIRAVIIKDKGSAKEGEKNKDKSQISVMSYSLIRSVLTFHTVLLMLKSGLVIANHVREFCYH